MGGGQEQYKIEVGSSNNFNFAELFCKYGGFRNDDEYIYIDGYENPDFEIDLDWDIKTPLTFHIGGEIIKATSTFEFGEFRFIYEDGDYTSFYASLTYDTVKHFQKKKLVKFKWRNPFGSIAKIKKSDFWICQGDVDDLDPKSHKQIILLPCQLMKVGDVKDRLYWDESKGKYMIEKNIGSYNEFSGLYFYREFDIVKYYSFDKTKIINDANKNRHGNKNYIAKGFKNVIYSNDRIDELNIFDSWHTHDFSLPKSTTLEEAERILKESSYILYQMETPELIETDITERIELPCYNPTTHIIVNSGNIEPSNIKALVPMKIRLYDRVVTDGLICWLDGRDYITGDRVWRDRSGHGNNGVIEGSINTETDKYENGCLTLENSTCSIPSLLFNSVKSICFFSDFKSSGKTGKWERFISESNGDNCICFWNNRYIRLNGETLPPKIGDKDCIQKLYLEISDDKERLLLNRVDDKEINFDANNRSIITDSVIQINGKGVGDKSKQSVASILIYNRVLTEEEIMQNYLYEQSIQRADV